MFVSAFGIGGSAVDTFSAVGRREVHLFQSSAESAEKESVLNSKLFTLKSERVNGVSEKADE
jgi:hypothetical protein